MTNTVFYNSWFRTKKLSTVCDRGKTYIYIGQNICFLFGFIICLPIYKNVRVKMII